MISIFSEINFESVIVLITSIELACLGAPMKLKKIDKSDTIAHAHRSTLEKEMQIEIATGAFEKVLSSAQFHFTILKISMKCISNPIIY